MKTILKNFVLSVSLFVLCVPSCTTKKNQVWVYTSVYKEVIAELAPELKKALPDLDVQWFQAGSENIASKLSAELAAGQPKADLIMTSDPFWYEELKEGGHLLAYESTAVGHVPNDYQDPDHTFVNVRLPVMAIGYHPDVVSEKEAPQSWSDLTLPKWKSKLAMPSPLESGTSFTTVAVLSKLFGWDYFKKLRANDILAAGGNSSVLNRIETKERPVGVLLLENMLKAKQKGSPVKIVYPKEGVVPVSSPLAILKASRQQENAKKVYDWFFSVQAQKAIAQLGYMYSFESKAGTPPGASEFSSIAKAKWNAALLKELFQNRDEIKLQFSKIVLQ